MAFYLLMTCRSCQKQVEFTAADEEGAWTVARAAGWEKNCQLDESTTRRKELMRPTCDGCSKQDATSKGTPLTLAPSLSG
jgi:hypothetical protein